MKMWHELAAAPAHIETEFIADLIYPLVSGNLLSDKYHLSY